MFHESLPTPALTGSGSKGSLMDLRPAGHPCEGRDSTLF
jgi:hypothetical protein